MIAIGIVVVIIVAALVAITTAASLPPRELTSTVENFRLTFGRQGQQILTMNGRDYHVWLDYKAFHLVDRGNVLRHIPSKVNIGGQTFLTTTITAVENKKNKDAAQTESGTEVPT